MLKTKIQTAMKPFKKETYLTDLDSAAQYVYSIGILIELVGVIIIGGSLLYYTLEKLEAAV